MKKIVSLFAIAAMMIGMVACTDDDDIEFIVLPCSGHMVTICVFLLLCVPFSSAL